MGFANPFKKTKAQQQPQSPAFNNAGIASGPTGNGGYNGVPNAELSDGDIEKLRSTDSKMKRQVRYFKFVSRAATAILSLAIFAILAATLHKFLSTRKIIIGGRNAWAKNTKLWPTLMLFVVALVDFLLNCFIFLGYLFSVNTANNMATLSTAYTIMTFTFHIILWAVVASLYKYGKDTHGVSNDLWGWSCSNGAAKIQTQFKDVVKFSHFCGIQTSSWRLSVATAVVQILAGLVWLMILRRHFHQKKVKRAETFQVQTF